MFWFYVQSIIFIVKVAEYRKFPSNLVMDYRSEVFSQAAAAAALTAHQHYHHYPGPTQAAITGSTYGYPSQYAHHTHPYYSNGYMSGLGANSNGDIGGLFGGSPSTSPGSSATNPNSSPLSNAIQGLTASPPISATLPTSPNTSSSMTSPFSLAPRCGTGRQWMGPSCKETYPYQGKGPSFYTGSGLASLVAQAANLPTIDRDTSNTSCNKTNNCYQGNSRQSCGGGSPRNSCRRSNDADSNTINRGCGRTDRPEEPIDASGQNQDKNRQEELDLETNKYYQSCFDSTNDETIRNESTERNDATESRVDSSPQSCADSPDTRQSQGRINSKIAKYYRFRTSQQVYM